MPRQRKNAPIKGTVTGISPRNSLDKLRPDLYTQPYAGKATAEGTKKMLRQQGIQPAYSMIFHDRREDPPVGTDRRSVGASLRSKDSGI